MAAITAEIGTVAKNLNVETGKGKGYKAVSERDVLDAVKPIENKYGIYSYPYSRETLESEKLESESTYNGNTTRKTTFYTRLRTVYRFVNIEEPSEYIDITSFGVGMDSQDKGDGKAMTYADKYAILKAYKISTGDDPDQEASEETDYSKAKMEREKKEKLDRFYNDQVMVRLHNGGNGDYAICEDCGAEITERKKKDGTVMTVHEFVFNSLKEYGKALCLNCIRKANAP